MNTIQLFNKIKIQISEISKLNDHLLSENKAAGALDIAMFKKQCVELYESILKLQEDPQTTVVETKELIVEAPIEVIKEVQIPVEKVEQTTLSMEDFEIKEAAIIGAVESEIPIQPANEFINEVLEEEPIATESIPEQIVVTEIVIEKKSNLINLPQSELSLHQKISGNKQADINERYNESKVESLKSAIGLNKKIAFVNELFSENTVEYAKAIDKLNLSVDLNEAMKFFNELKHQNSWDNENENVMELEQLIQKRFR